MPFAGLTGSDRGFITEYLCRGSQQRSAKLPTDKTAFFQELSDIPFAPDQIMQLLSRELAGSEQLSYRLWRTAWADVKPEPEAARARINTHKAAEVVLSCRRWRARHRSPEPVPSCRGCLGTRGYWLWDGCRCAISTVLPPAVSPVIRERGVASFPVASAVIFPCHLSVQLYSASQRWGGVTPVSVVRGLNSPRE